MQNPGLLTEYIRQNAKFGKRESILAQNPVVGRAELPLELTYWFG